MALSSFIAVKAVIFEWVSTWSHWDQDLIPLFKSKEKILNSRLKIIGAKMNSVQSLFLSDFIARTVFFYEHAKEVK